MESAEVLLSGIVEWCVFVLCGRDEEDDEDAFQAHDYYNRHRK